MCGCTCLQGDEAPRCPASPSLRSGAHTTVNQLKGPQPPVFPGTNPPILMRQAGAAVVKQNPNWCMRTRKMSGNIQARDELDAFEGSSQMSRPGGIKTNEFETTKKEKTLLVSRHAVR